MPEDMTVPQFYYGDGFVGGKTLESVSLLDIAPTVAAIMGISPEPEWEGHSLKNKES